jgi:hypothetical protein
MFTFLFEILKSVFGIEEKNFCEACGEIIEEGERHIRCENRLFVADFPKCPYCGYSITAAESHKECLKRFNKMIRSENQCIYCAKKLDEKDHQKCRVTLGRYVTTRLATL